MTNRQSLGCLVVVLTMAMSSSSLASGSARVTFLEDTSGVEASAHSYQPPRLTTTHSSGSSKQVPLGFVGGTRVLVPLVAQTVCGHDPRLPGGQTCALDPPPRPSLAQVRRPRRPPSPEEVARRLADRAIRIAPRPQLRLAPGRRGLTGLPSYFWLAQRPRRIEATAAAGRVGVTAQARPVQYVWTYGDGTDEATRRSGRRWTRNRSGTISHTYETKGRYTLVVEVIWHARWRIAGRPWQSLGYFSNSDSRPYRVRSIVPVLVKSD